MHTKSEILEAFSRLLDIQDELREKCPWDNKQTNESLRPHTIEEVYELCDAILSDDPKEIQKEMGDVMEHLVFYAMIGREKGLFDMGDVLEKEADKLVFRHPHIYGDKSAANSDEVSKIWEQVKQKEKDGNKTVLSGVPKSLPSLIKAYRIQDKARNVGFDWEEKEDVWEKVFEEIGELKEEFEKGDKDAAEKELGDLLFAIVNAARLYHINPDTALEQTNRKFITRFEYIEKKAKSMGRNIKDLTLGEMEKLWQEAKGVLLCIMTILVVAACTNTTRPNMDIEDEMVGAPDSAIYGTVGDATSMHVLTIVTDNGREMAVAMNQDTIHSDIQGGLYAGDNICVTTMPDPSDPKRGMKMVAKAVNLTSLLGHWISLDRNFTIKENGIIEAKNNIESKPYTSWQMRNCQLILNADTFDIIALTPDSLVLEGSDGVYGYKRKK